MFEKGVSGNPNGRPKGPKFKFDVVKILQEMQLPDGSIGVNPFVILGEIAYNKSNSAHVRTLAASELASYVAPKLKSVELTSDSENPFSITLNLGGPPKE